MIIENTKPYIRSSAVVWRWNTEASSARTDESSSDLNLTFPRWRIAATSLKIAS